MPRTKQLSLDLRRRSWGGPRAGAGRKRRPDAGPPHRGRPLHHANHPVHLTLRALPGVPSFRAERAFAVIKRCIAQASKGAFRVVHFSVQRDHLHLIVEANDKRTLSRGARSLAIRLALRINRLLARHGRMWKERYHARALTRPREVRNALVYVLMNHRKHHASAAWLDPRSSAAWFDGWHDDRLLHLAWADVHHLACEPSPVERPRTWLAREGWRRHSLLGVEEGLLARRARSELDS